MTCYMMIQKKNILAGLNLIILMNRTLKCVILQFYSFKSRIVTQFLHCFSLASLLLKKKVNMLLIKRKFVLIFRHKDSMFYNVFIIKLYSFSLYGFLEKNQPTFNCYSESANNVSQSSRIPLNLCKELSWLRTLDVTKHFCVPQEITKLDQGKFLFQLFVEPI